MRIKELQRILKEEGFKIDENEGNASTGWYHCGSNELNINILNKLIKRAFTLNNNKESD